MASHPSTFRTQRTSTPDVYLGIVTLLTVDDLRSDPKRTPLHRSVGTYHINIVRLRDSEIRKFPKPRPIHENGIRFQFLRSRHTSVATRKNEENRTR